MYLLPYGKSKMITLCLNADSDVDMYQFPNGKGKLEKGLEILKRQKYQSPYGKGKADLTIPKLRTNGRRINSQMGKIKTILYYKNYTLYFLRRQYNC